jgi:putative hydrolase of the HAD superfamily
MKPKAICFDLDDTLVVFDGVTQRAWDQTFERFAEALGEPGRVRACMDELAAWYWSDPVRHTEGRSDLKKTRRMLLRTTFERLARTDMALADEVADFYTVHREELMEPVPGALDTVRALADAGIRLASITNGEGFRQRAKLERFGLAPHFPIVLVEGELGFGKPDARVYRRALELLGTEPSETWMVGDHLVWDIEGAQAVGLRAAWFDWRGVGLPAESTTRPDLVVGSIPELLELIR